MTDLSEGCEYNAFREVWEIVESEVTSVLESSELVEVLPHQVWRGE